MTTLVPAIVVAAEKNDFQSMLALASMGGGGEPNMSIGMQLSVICAEDAPKNTPDDLQKESESTLFGKYVMTIQQQACTFWPRGKVDAVLLRAREVGDSDAGAVRRKRSGHAAELGRASRVVPVECEAHRHAPAPATPPAARAAANASCASSSKTDRRPPSIRRASTR